MLARQGLICVKWDRPKSILRTIAKTLLPCAYSDETHSVNVRATYHQDGLQITQNFIVYDKNDIPLEDPEPQSYNNAEIINFINHMDQLLIKVRRPRIEQAFSSLPCAEWILGARMPGNFTAFSRIPHCERHIEIISNMLKHDPRIQPHHISTRIGIPGYAINDSINECHEIASRVRGACIIFYTNNQYRVIDSTGVLFTIGKPYLDSINPQRLM
jgi:hypothetical protein